MNGNLLLEPPKLNPYVVIMAALLFIISLVATSSYATFNQTNERTIRVEQKVGDIEKRLDRMETKLDALYRNKTAP